MARRWLNFGLCGLISWCVSACAPMEQVQLYRERSSDGYVSSAIILPARPGQSTIVDMHLNGGAIVGSSRINIQSSGSGDVTIIDENNRMWMVGEFSSSGGRVLIQRFSEGFYTPVGERPVFVSNSGELNSPKGSSEQQASQYMNYMKGIVRQGLESANRYRSRLLGNQSELVSVVCGEKGRQAGYVSINNATGFRRFEVLNNQVEGYQGDIYVDARTIPVNAFGTMGDILSMQLRNDAANEKVEVYPYRNMQVVSHGGVERVEGAIGSDVAEWITLIGKARAATRAGGCIYD